MLSPTCCVRPLLTNILPKIVCLHVAHLVLGILDHVQHNEVLRELKWPNVNTTNTPTEWFPWNYSQISHCRRRACVRRPNDDKTQTAATTAAVFPAQRPREAMDPMIPIGPSKYLRSDSEFSDPTIRSLRNGCMIRSRLCVTVSTQSTTLYKRSIKQMEF